MNAMLGLEKYLRTCGLPQTLLNPIKFRVSQINGCAYCLDMHSKDLPAAGDTEQRLYMLDAWRESPLRSVLSRGLIQPHTQRSLKSWRPSELPCRSDSSPGFGNRKAMARQWTATYPTAKMAVG